MLTDSDGYAIIAISKPRELPVSAYRPVRGTAYVPALEAAASFDTSLQAADGASSFEAVMPFEPDLALQVVDSVYLSSFLNLRLYSLCSEVKRLCVVLCKPLDYRTTDVRGFRATITLIALNLVRNRANDRRRSLGVSLNSNDYAALSVSYRHVTNAVDAMTQAGLLELAVKGFPSKTPGNGLRTRYRATPAFFDLVHSCGVTPAMVLSKPLSNDSLVVLNSEKDDKGNKHPVKWPNSAKAQRTVMVANLKVINRAIRESFVALHVTDDQLVLIHDAVGRRPKERAIDFQEKGLGRIFHDSSPKKGGRFYNAWWQSVPSEYRKHIHIATAAEPTPACSCELDYKAMHPSILFAKANEPCPHDPYKIYGGRTDDQLRRIIKTAFMCIINNTSRTAAIKAINNKEREYYEAEVASWEAGSPATSVREMLPPGCPPIPDLLADIEKAFAPISQYFYTGIGKELMYLDSQIAEQVMLAMLKDSGTIALPVHDSFIVKSGHEAKLEQVMKQKFHDALGFEVPIKHDVTESQQAAIKSAYEAEYGYNPFVSDDDQIEWVPDDADARDEYTVYDALVSDWERGHVSGSKRRIR